LTRNARALHAMLLGRDHPATANDLYEELRAAGEHTGLTTIYRSLHALAEAGVVHEFRTVDQSAYLICPPEPHQHLICRSCGRVQRQPIDDTQYRLATADSLGFVITEHRIESYGMCRRCHR
jgi:Fur family transcriptional regulator, ferric uptake regulator